LLVALLFHPLKGLIQRAFDRYLYREPYDYQRTIREASRALSGTIELPLLLGHVANIVNGTLRPEGLAIYVFDGEDRQFQRVQVSGSLTFSARFPADAPVVELAAKEGRPVFRDELNETMHAVLKDFETLNAEVVVPLVEESQVIGLLAVAAKRSGDPYFSDDADLLGTLGNQSAVAIRNGQVHQQVLEVSEHLQKILATIESGVLSVNARGRITLFNRAAEVMTGAGRSLRGRPMQELPPPLADILEISLRDGQPHSQAEMLLPDAAGQLVPLMCSTSPLRGAQGALVGAVAVLNDLSQLKELEQEKRRAERLASLEAIASGMVHEIRNPLVAIKTFTQLLPVRFDDPSYRESFGRVSDREITRIEELLDRFRTLASASSQPMELLDVSEPLDAALDLLRPQLEERRINVRYVAATQAPRFIPGNASQLQSLFMNLCLNALEAMDPGGELTVRLVDLGEAGGTTLLVEVSDTGPGIPDDLLPRIFNPFVTTKARGSGLGLAICRSIADAHHASLRARSDTEGRGSTFTIEFPVPLGQPAKTGA
jgi:PAS domain S-box-containing protein